MWADSTDTMIVPGKERAESLVPGRAYWMSTATMGLFEGKLIAFDDDWATVWGPGGEHTFRMADTSFYTEKPR